MKQSLFFILFLFSISMAGQQNGIRLNFKSFQSYERGTIVNDTSILLTPQLVKNSKTTFYSISMTYLRKIENFTIYGGFGVNWNNEDFSSMSNNNTYFRSESTNKNQKDIQLHSGLLKTIPSSYHRVEFIIGAGLAYEYRFEKNYSSNFDRLDLNGQFLDGQSLNVNYCNLWTIGTTIELGVYFSVIKNISIGINHHTWFYLQKEKGKDVFNLSQFGSNRTLLNNSTSDRIVDKKIFGKNNLFSYSILLKF